MSWFIYALITMLAWGGADLFYKKAADEEDRYSHLKTSIAVGLVMGIHGIFTLLTGGFSYDPVNLLRYLPVSAMYILSMTVGYFGLRYLELSISSPIQNTSGVIVCILCALFLNQRAAPPAAIAVGVICAAVFLLGVIEKRANAAGAEEAEKKYRIGFAAFFLPILYCVIDALGTFFDAWYLDSAETTPLVGVTEESLETVANVSYELTFFFTAILLAVYVYGIRRQRIGKNFRPARYGAAVLETAGQFTYVYAMSGEAMAAAPMVAAYSIVSMLLSRVFLKEKLTLRQYLCIFAVMAGIIVLGIYDI